MKSASVLKSTVIALAIFAAAGTANAGTMTFDNLLDFQNYSEDGMNMVSNDVWNWPGEDMAHMDPGSVAAFFSLENSATFNLDSVDMIADGGSGPARFSAYLGGNLLGFVDIASDVGTYDFGALFAGIDGLRVSVVSSHFTFDNLVWTDVTTEVPEPGSLALFGLGALALASRRRLFK